MPVPSGKILGIAYSERNHHRETMGKLVEERDSHQRKIAREPVVLQRAKL